MRFSLKSSIPLLAIFFFTIASLYVFANSATIDPSFNFKNPVWLDNSVTKVVKQLDGKLLVGGFFSTYQWISVNRIIRLNVDGTRDTTFSIDNWFNDNVNDLALQSNGKIIVGGNFSVYKWISANKIIRLNPDGSRDPSFDMGIWFNNKVNKIAIQTNGKIIVIWDFTTYKWASANKIIRLNSDGSRDNSFDVGNGFNYYTECIAIQDDGKIIVGGWFTSYNWTNINRIIRLNSDGSRDTSFDVGNGFNNEFVAKIIIQPDGKMVVGWRFTTYKWVNANGLLRINSDGSRDNSFVNNTSDMDDLRDLALQNDGKIIAWWCSSQYNCTQHNIIRLNTDWSIDNSFDIGKWFDSQTNSLMVDTNGKIIVGGWFRQYKWTAARWIIILDTDGTRDDYFKTWDGLSDYIGTILMQPDKKMIIVGGFYSYGWVNSKYIMRLNPDGSRDSSFDIGDGFDSLPNTAVLQDDGKIIVGWWFTSYKWVSANHIIRLNPDGSRDNSFNMGNGFNSIVWSILTQNDGKIIVEGYSNTYNRSPTTRIVRLNTDWTKDTSFNPVLPNNWWPFPIAQQSDGKLLVGGSWYSYELGSSWKIIRLNTDWSIDNSFNWDNFNQYIRSIQVQNDWKILVGWDFTAYKWVSNNHIVRLNLDGSRDSSFDMGIWFNDYIVHIWLQGDWKIIVIWDFTTYGNPSDSSIGFCSDWITPDQQTCEAAWFCSDWIAPDQQSCQNAYSCSDWYSTTQQSCEYRACSDWYHGDQQSCESSYSCSDWYYTDQQSCEAASYCDDRTSTDQQSCEAAGYNRNNAWNYWYQNYRQNQSSNYWWQGLLTRTSAYTWTPGKKFSHIIRLNNDGSVDTWFDIGEWFNFMPTSLYIQSGWNIFVWWAFTSYNWQAAGYITALYGDKPVVYLPDSSDSYVVANIFKAAWYEENQDGTLLWDVPISLSQTNGAIPTTLHIQNQAISLSLSKWTQISNSFNNQYNWIISVPVENFSINSIFWMPVLLAFKVGSVTNLKLIWWTANISVPISGDIWDAMYIYYSQDNGVSRYYETATNVVDNNWATSITFTTNHFGEFAILSAAGITQTIWNIWYSITWFTNQDVSAFLNLNQWWINNNNWNNTYLFTGNGVFTFTYQDPIGRIWSNIATVNWIDKEPPVISWIVNNWIYTWSVELISVYDNNGIVSVKLDNITLTSRTNKTISEVWNHTIIATDIANNDKTIQFEIRHIAGSNTWSTNIPDENTWSSNDTPSNNAGGSNGGWGGGSFVDSVVNSVKDLFHSSSEDKPAVSVKNSTYTPEINTAYVWAYNAGITTIPTVQAANIEGKVYRSHLAKMISEYAINVLKKPLNTGLNCSFPDMKNQSQELQQYSTTACQLGLMGLKTDWTPDTKFNPNAEITRAQFATTLSRLLRGNKNSTGSTYYEGHLQALKKAWIMTKISTPSMKELRWNVFLMLQRAATK